MSILRNRYVMCILVGIALVLGYYRFRTPPVVAAPPPVVKKERPQMVGPDASVEVDKLGWTPAPARDPFSSTASTVIAEGDEQAEADPVAFALDLKAVWLQETGGWAVINGKIVTEGDSILDFRVEKIRADSVLVQSPSGRRQVNFKGTPAPANPLAAPLAGVPSIPNPINGLTMPDSINPLSMQEATNAIQQILAQDITAAAGRTGSPEKAGP